MNYATASTTNASITYVSFKSSSPAYPQSLILELLDKGYEIDIVTALPVKWPS